MDSRVSLAVEDGDPAVTIAAKGEIDMHSCDIVAETVIGELDRHAHVVLDLAGVSFLDSAGLSGLIRARNHALALGRSFRVRGANGLVAQVLEITGLGDVLTAGGAD